MGLSPLPRAIVSPVSPIVLEATAIAASLHRLKAEATTSRLLSLDITSISLPPPLALGTFWGQIQILLCGLIHFECFTPFSCFSNYGNSSQSPGYGQQQQQKSGGGYGSQSGGYGSSGGQSGAYGGSGGQSGGYGGSGGQQQSSPHGGGAYNPPSNYSSPPPQSYGQQSQYGQGGERDVTRN